MKYNELPKEQIVMIARGEANLYGLDEKGRLWKRQTHGKIPDRDGKLIPKGWLLQDDVFYAVEAEPDTQEDHPEIPVEEGAGDKKEA